MPEAEELRSALRQAEERLDAANAARVRADALSNTAREMGGGIPGFGGSGNQSAARAVRAAHGRADKAHREAAERIEKWEHRVRSLRQRITEVERVRFTPGQLKGAVFVRSKHGWHRVVRVNVKTVTVPSLVGGSWTDTIPVESILEARFPE